MSTTDQSLLRRLQSDPDNSSWREFETIYRPFIEGQLRRYRKSLSRFSDDVVQDVMIILLSEIRDFEWSSPGDFRSWLRVVTLNRIRSLASRRCHESIPKSLHSWLENLEDPHSDASDFWNREHDAHVLNAVLGIVKKRVEPLSWRIFFSAFVQGKPAVEVAKAFDVDVVHVYDVKSRLLRYARQEAEGFVD